MSVENLWGELPEVGDLRTPLDILREQAALLGQMTNKLLEAFVDLREQGVKIEADLGIVAPTLDGYTVTIVKITYGLGLYPASVIDIVAQKAYHAGDEGSFREALRRILASTDVQLILRSLLAQVRPSE